MQHVAYDEWAMYVFNGTCRAGSDPAILPFAMEDQILVSCSKDEDCVI